MKSKILGILIALLFAAGYVTLNYPVLGTLYNQIREGKVRILTTMQSIRWIRRSVRSTGRKPRSIMRCW